MADIGEEEETIELFPLETPEKAPAPKPEEVPA